MFVVSYRGSDYSFYSYFEVQTMIESIIDFEDISREQLEKQGDLLVYQTSEGL